MLWVNSRIGVFCFAVLRQGNDNLQDSVLQFDGILQVLSLIPPTVALQDLESPGACREAGRCQNRGEAKEGAQGSQQKQKSESTRH